MKNLPPPKDPKKYAEYIKRQSESHKGQVSPMKGKKHKPESNEKNSISHLGLSSPNKGTKLSTQHRKNLSLAKIGKPSPRKGAILSKLTKKRISVSLSGINNPNFGKNLPVETCNKISKALQDIPRTKEWNEKNSKAKKGKPNGRDGEKHPLFGKPPWNLGIPHSESTKSKLKYKRSFRIIPFKDTKPERMMQIALSMNNIKFEKHKMITNGKGFYHQVDIFIEPNICVEVDGDYWHKRSKTMARDVIVNHELSIMGFFIIRIWESDIKKNTQQCAENIIKMIKARMELKE